MATSTVYAGYDDDNIYFMFVAHDFVKMSYLVRF